MDLVFERGDRAHPRGHALVYFRDRGRPGRILACYVVLPPLKFELARYMPPLLQQQLPQAGLADVTAVPLPPIPEEIATLADLERLAVAREDDLLYAGEVDASRMDQLLASATEASGAYLALYTEGLQATEASPQGDDLDPEIVVWEVLGNRERLGELAKLVGQARYATAGADTAAAEQLRRRMGRLGALLPGSFRIERIIEAAVRPGPEGDQLSTLYIDRCYKLLDEDYRALEHIDLQIHQLEHA